MKNLQNLQVDKMNFSYATITAVGILVGISIFFIAMSPDDVIEPRTAASKCISDVPICGVDGITYENRCMLEFMGVEANNVGPCVEEDVEDIMVVPVKVVEQNIVSIPLDSSVVGCETTNECYLPFEKIVSAGSTVVWSNDDIAAHTVTSGSAQEITNMFDSGLIPPNGTFDYTFDNVGSFDYFCIVHPWMLGVVTVN